MHELRKYEWLQLGTRTFPYWMMMMIVGGVDDHLRDKVQRLSAASAKSGLPWLCETNSYSGGGCPGLSDTPLGVLWTLDYMLFLATQDARA